MKQFFLAFLLALVVNISLSGQTTADTAINFNIKDIHGSTHVLFDILAANKYVVLDFFSTSCGPCSLYAPEIEQSYQHFGANTGNVYFLGVCWGSDNMAVAQFDSIYGVTYPTVSGMQGGGNQVNLDYNIQSYPTVIIIAPDKQIINQYVWPPSTQNLDSLITAYTGITVGEEYVDHSFEKEKQSFSIYPNPVNGYLTLNSNQEVSQSVFVHILDMEGRILIKEKMNEGMEKNGSYMINVAMLQEGTYIVSLQSTVELLGNMVFVKQ